MYEKNKTKKIKYLWIEKLGQTQVNISSKQGRLSRQIHCYFFFPMRNLIWVRFQSLFALVFAPFFSSSFACFLEEGSAYRCFLDLTCRAHFPQIRVGHVAIDSLYGSDVSFLRPSLFLWRLGQNIGRFIFFFALEFDFPIFNVLSPWDSNSMKSS